jgi:hypothetical protein
MSIILWVTILFDLLSDPSVVDEEAHWYPLQDNPMLQASLNSHDSGTSSQ